MRILYEINSSLCFSLVLLLTSKESVVVTLLSFQFLLVVILLLVSRPRIESCVVHRVFILNCVFFR